MDNKNTVFILFGLLLMLNINCAIYPKHLLYKKEIRKIKKDLRNVNELKPYSRGFEIKKSYITKDYDKTGGLYYVERRLMFKPINIIVPIIIIKNKYIMNTGTTDSLKLNMFLNKLKSQGYSEKEIEEIDLIFNKGISKQSLWYQHHKLGTFSK